MNLIATYDMHYGPAGPVDAERPLIRRGETFEVQPTIYADAAEAARILIRQGAAVTPEAWAKRKPKGDAIAAEVAKLVDGFRRQAPKKAAT